MYFQFTANRVKRLKVQCRADRDFVMVSSELQTQHFESKVSTQIAAGAELAVY